MTLRQWVEDRVFELTGGTVAGGSPEEISRLTFISDDEAIRKSKLKEYVTWYKGDDDELNNLYNKENVIEFSTEPWYWKNKRSYFWTVASTESDVKRTTAGLAQDMINTMVGIVGTPTFDVYKSNDARTEMKKKIEETGVEEKTEETKTIEKIFDNIDFLTMLREEQEPMTLVEGWGCYKTEWDLNVSDEPTERYYRANDVYFVSKSNKVIAAIFLDWYRGKEQGERYLATEIRCIVPRVGKDKKIHRDLHIMINTWKAGDGDDTTNVNITPVNRSVVHELDEVEDHIVIEDMDSLLAQPCIYWKDATNPTMPGKSVFQNKISLLDDLDQAYSQMANTVGKSTPEELFNSDFLDRDPETRMPVMPHRYDRKYTTFTGGRDAQGGTNTNVPVQVTQPNLNITMYQQAITQISSQILSGYMSPATMGISVSVQATAESQREKEKVTVFTRQHIVDCNIRILTGVINDLLMAHEYLHSDDHVIRTKKYDISVKYEPFATATFEEKAATLFQLMDNGDMSPEMFVQKVYGSTLSEKERQHELNYLREAKLKKEKLQSQMYAQNSMFMQNNNDASASANADDSAYTDTGSEKFQA